MSQRSSVLTENWRRKLVSALKKLEYLMSINTTVAFCDEAIDIFVAHNLIPSHQHLDEDEFVDVKAYKLEELKEMIFEGKIQDSKTMAAILAYESKYLHGQNA